MERVSAQDWLDALPPAPEASSSAAALQGVIENVFRDVAPDAGRPPLITSFLRLYDSTTSRLVAQQNAPVAENDRLALLACCGDLVAAAEGIEALRFPAALTRACVRANMLEFRGAVRRVLAAWASPAAGVALPATIKEYLTLLDARILDRFLWEPGSTLHALITRLAALKPIAGACGRRLLEAPPGVPLRPDVTDALRAVGLTAAPVLESLAAAQALAVDRLAGLCALPGWRADMPAWVPAKTAKTMAYLMDERLELLGGRHLMQVVACALYASAKLGGNAVLMREIIVAIQAQPYFVAEDGITPAPAPGSPPAGPNHAQIKTFYNSTFVPDMQARLSS